MKRLTIILKRITIYILAFAGAILSIALLCSLIAWMRTPIYDFPEPEKFKGAQWYNPYKNLDSLKWYKANFHAHSNAWGPFTNGKDNTTEQVYEAYHKLGYEFMTLSNYQSITEKTNSGFPYIPAQEYGVNILKTHLLLIGSQSPVYLDQILIQGPNTKQNRINKLRNETEVIVLAHPSWQYGFTEKDMRILGGYDLLEVLNDFKNSIEYWDIALSAGKPAFLLANDDTHNVFKNNDLARRITMIPHSAKHSQFLYQTLRDGATYGVNVCSESATESIDKKNERISSYPQLISINLINDSLSISLSDTVSHFKFIGDDGKELHKVDMVASASYKAKETDSYIRIEAHLPDGTFYLFNPTIRTEDGKKPEMPQIYKSKIKSNIKITLIVLGLIIIYIYIRKRFFKKKKRK